VPVADLVELGHAVLQGIRDARFIIALDTKSSGELMQRRAEKTARGELPTVRTGGAFE
jgi:hypothetical protein